MLNFDQKYGLTPSKNSNFSTFSNVIFIVKKALFFL